MKPTHHKKPARLESRLSMTLTTMLVIIGIGVFMQQYHFNPAVIALQPESHQQTPSQVAKPQNLLDTGDSGIVPFSAPERFNRETLYEKIDGRADLYLSSGVVSLETQRFTADPASGRWVEVFVYDMATPENAFSVFSMQRREGARPDDIAPNAYRTENALYLAVGNFYLEFIGTDASAELQVVMGKLAGIFLQGKSSGTATEAPGADLFPRDDRQPNSLQLITANAFGTEQLDQVYTCAYLQNGAKLTAFVSRRTDGGTAAALADIYRQTLLSYGAVAVDTAIPVKGAFTLQVFDTYEIIFTRGSCLAGIHEADNLDAAVILAGRLAVHLENLEK